MNTTTGMSNSFSLDREPPFEIEYTYSVEWKPTDVSPKKRLSLLKDYRFIDCITEERFILKIEIVFFNIFLNIVFKKQLYIVNVNTYLTDF